MAETRPDVRELAFQRFDQLVLTEIERSRPRIKRLRKRYPEADTRYLARLLIDRKKAYAGTGGMVTGIFGLVALPADLILVTWLQTSLIVEIGQLYRANLKSRYGQREVLGILGRGNGVGPLVRSGSPILARVAVQILARRGLPTLGRAVPFVAAPVNAWLNNRDIERVGDEALRYYSAGYRLADRRGGDEP